MSVVARQLTGPANVPFSRLTSKVSRTVPSNATYLLPTNELNIPGLASSGLDCFGCSLETRVGTLSSRDVDRAADAICASAWRTCFSKSADGPDCGSISLWRGGLIDAG